ncbi:MAG: hypothetical protein CO029_04035 [Candidatus Magasanikbacteria bacterium CG_4_9_14_0_2_um_filter_41_10]|uniref:Uncharacterized protein n=1 Tax=Candidatus Magasanikbacteria bacterium CG_4_10_14_0_2_um_filter_41_31 TaxID=1974639 RepID=A0A2M7V1P6_9BACT|nr:MAG: hypothetical protein AUJ37_04010 [Candidatus Magasanikbacteria bacterium CG1_02_41_34]PIZ92262.1 MAG: hypothetical protein COX83_04630 [Candidatus Magasanikbacteria bacterium CG_4_10_14_0_2_um_filter_41_31]PJC53189.1 MAG: hypothetical protein CO029_04035 [Candidatus Magasanikbacteria bacterium CG_4_9_14_0_2_um_filter_41_10]
MSQQQNAKTIEGRLKQDIDNTIDALEASIRGNETHINEHGKTGRRKRIDPRDRIAQDYANHAYKQRIVWTSVGFITISIMSMWGWNMRTVFYDASNGKYAVETPLSTVGARFTEAMQIAGAKDAQAEESESIRTAADVLKDVVVAATAISTEEASPPSTLDTLANTLSTHVSSTPTSTDNTTTTP